MGALCVLEFGGHVYKLYTYVRNASAHLLASTGSAISHLNINQTYETPFHLT